MSDAEAFLDRVMIGQSLITEIDDFVDEWHEGPSTRDLHEYLGMNLDEYSLWLENPDMLGVICMARRRQQSLAQAVKDTMPELRLAARADDSAKLSRLESWLKRQGQIP